MKNMILILSLTLFAAMSQAKDRPAGHDQGGGGLGADIEFEDIQKNLRGWVSKDIRESGLYKLKLPKGLSHEDYQQKMLELLKEGVVDVEFTEEKVSFRDGTKTCRSYFSRERIAPSQKIPSINLRPAPGLQPHIQCNKQDFESLKSWVQYQMGHHEFASLAGIERNQGQKSDYNVSSQITMKVEYERVVHISVITPDQDGHYRGIIRSSFGDDGEAQVLVKRLADSSSESENIQFTFCPNASAHNCRVLGSLPSSLLLSEPEEIREYQNQITWQEVSGGVAGALLAGALGAYGATAFFESLPFGSATARQIWYSLTHRPNPVVNKAADVTASIFAIGGFWAGQEVGDALDGKELSPTQINALLTLANQPQILSGQEATVPYKVSELAYMLEEVIGILGTPAQ